MKTRKQTLVVLYPGCIEFEIKLALELVSRISDMCVVAPSTAPLKGSSGFTYLPDMSYQQALAERFDCVLIPGGNVSEVIELPELHQLLRQANDHGAVMAAICAGPILLAISGLLKNKRHVNLSRYPKELEYIWEGSQFEKSQVVVDGNIITALPEAHIDFGATVATALGVFDSEQQAQQSRQYYKGLTERDWSLLGR
jgi:putative intracellular protease/amidase